MLTQQVQPCLAIGRRLDYVLSTENVEERPADANVLIRGWAESDRFAFKCYGGASELTSVSNFGSRALAASASTLDVFHPSEPT